MAERRRLAVPVRAPMAGTVVDLADTPDPVFAGGVVGRGLALLPLEPDALAQGSDRLVVVAPCAGRLVSVYPHAVMIQADGERAVLVHLGLGTEELEDAGFQVAARQGDRVSAGQPLMAWVPATVRARGRSVLCPVVALQADEADLLRLVRPGDEVEEGQDLLVWS